MTATNMTIRQQIIALLQEGARDALGLSKALRVSQHQVEEHLKHVERSIESSKKGKFLTIPATCLGCRYIFNERKERRMTKPGKCPKCRGEHISLPLYEIRILKK